jgi:hypothetical protein
MEKPDLDPLVQLLSNREALARMGHTRHREIRNSLPDNSALQPYLAPFEHRSFAREEVADNPLKAIPLLGMIPAYQGAKAVGLMGARTDPSWEQIKQGNLGILDGLRAYFGR